MTTETIIWIHKDNNYSLQVENDEGETVILPLSFDACTQLQDLGIEVYASVC
jgi:hypothetical protein